jgi:hypothetical protein
MPNALDMYRAQQSAATAVHERLSEVSALVQQLRREVDTLAKNHELRDLIRQEQTWLEQAERAVKEVQRWRDLEACRFWPGVVYRWIFALAFALFAVWASSAGNTWMNRDHNRELAELQSRLALLDVIEQRAATLPVREQQQLRKLLNWPTAPTTTNEAKRPTN